MTYTLLFKQSIALYLEGRYQESYQLITDHTEELKDYESHLYNLRFCTACMAGESELTLRLMKEAIQEKGYWYSYDYLYREEDLKAIRDMEEFVKLAEICKQREEAAKASTQPDIIVVDAQHPMEDKQHPIEDKQYPVEDKQYPVEDKQYHVEDKQYPVEDRQHPFMMILHGNGQNAKIAKENWQSGLTGDYIVAFPQSSQVEFSGAYVWNDYHKGLREIEAWYDRMIKDYPINPEKVIIGGFSAGTRTALYAVLTDTIKVKGFILNGSWLPELSEWEPMFDMLKDKEIRGYIICGEQDGVSLEHTQRLADLLKEKGIEHILHMVEHMGHDYPSDFDRYLEEAISFIMKEA